MPHYNVLFLCTGNSARSILAEAIVNHTGGQTFTGYSAGSFPAGQVNPFALQLLEQMKLPTQGLHSKNWEVFSGANAPQLDFVFSVCDQAAAEPCPIWPGQPMTAHWRLLDPAAVEGSDEQKQCAFRDTFIALRSRIGLFTNLPIASLDRLKLKSELDAIGQSQPEAK